MSLELLLDRFDLVIQTPADVEKLNQTILQLAAMGRLVPQDPNDEPADVLLERIAAEKKRLVNDGKIRKGNILSPVTSKDLPNVTPSGWEWVRLGICIELISGQHIKRENYNEEGIGFPYLTGPSDFGELFPTVTKWTTKPKTFAEIDDILLTVKGAGLGKLNLSRIGHLVISRQLMAVRPVLIHSRYVYLFLMSKYSYFQSIGVGIAIPGINRNAVNNLLFPLPPLGEQARIMANVDKLFAQSRELASNFNSAESHRKKFHTSVIHQLTEAKTPKQTSAAWHLIHNNFDRLYTDPQSIAELKQAILQLAVMGRLVPQDPNDEPADVLLERITAEKERLIAEKKIRKSKPLSEIGAEERPYSLPKGWEWVRWLDISPRVTVGHVGAMKNEYVKEGIPFLRNQNVRENRFDPRGLCFISPKFHKRLGKSKLAPGDLVVVRSGLVGVTCVIPDELTDSNCADLVIIKKPPFFISEYGSFYMNSLARTIVAQGQVGIALTHFNTKSVAAMPVPLPPLPEQKRIVTRVNTLLQLCDNLTTHIQQAQSTQTALRDAVLSHNL